MKFFKIYLQMILYKILQKDRNLAELKLNIKKYDIINFFNLFLKNRLNCQYYILLNEWAIRNHIIIFRFTE